MTTNMEEIELKMEEMGRVIAPGLGTRRSSPRRQIINRLVESTTLITRGCGTALLLLVLACASLVAQAQTLKEPQDSAPEIKITTDHGLVRFAVPESSPESRLEVFTEAGEQIFDSSPVASPVLEWQLQDQQGQPVATGKYLYVLTIKDQAGTPWMQHGQIAVNSDGTTNNNVLITGGSLARGEVQSQISDLNQAAASNAAAVATLYKVEIKTSRYFDSGTDANVYLRIFGWNSYSQDTRLDVPGYNDFEMGSLGTYYITTPDDLGNLRYILLRHDNTGSKPGWRVVWVEITNVNTGNWWRFPVCRWLAKDVCDQQIALVLYPNTYPNCSWCGLGDR